MRLPTPRRTLAAVATATALLISVVACSTTEATPTGPAAPAAAPAALVQASLTVPANLRDGAFATPRSVLIPPGWAMSLWAAVPDARLAAWTPDGALLVSRPGEGQIVRLAPDAAGATATPAVLLDGLEQPHGMAFDGSTLYVAESNRIQAYDYAGGRATNPRTVVDDLPDAKSAELGGHYAHALKTVIVGPDRSLYFSIGSSGNISDDDREADPQRATIMRVPPGGGAAEVFARGVRNGTGLAIAPDESVWTAVNNRDNIEYPYDREYPGSSGSAQGEVLEGYVADHPAEELARLTPGRDLGWPYCNPDPDVEPGVSGTGYDYTTPPYVDDYETNHDGSELDCSKLTPIEQGLGAHSAPLGMIFGELPAPYGQGALVGVHGSWNRQPPRAPEVSFFPWTNGTLGAQETLVGGFQAEDGSRWGRPVAAVPGPDGAVYVTDDEAGAVYRLVPAGS
jgi:glucose/arabinose dehydrogenase